MKVLIDNGHGVETEGKRSPDGRLREYAYTREIADRVMNRLQTEGIESIRIIPEETDVELKERVARAKSITPKTTGRSFWSLSIAMRWATERNGWRHTDGAYLSTLQLPTTADGSPPIWRTWPKARA